MRRNMVSSGEIYDAVLTKEMEVYRRHPFCKCGRRVSPASTVRIWSWGKGSDEIRIVRCPFCLREFR